MPPKKRRPGPKSKTQGTGEDEGSSPEPEPQPGPSRRPGPKSKTQQAASASPTRRPGPKSRTQAPPTSPSASSTAPSKRSIFQCNQCSLRFLEKRLLAVHKKREHPDYVESVRTQSIATASVAEEPIARKSQASPRRSAAQKTRPSANDVHKTSKPDKSKLPKHKTRNVLPIPINNPRVAANKRTESNPSTSSG